ncbi:MAG TPA: hypothetical protein VK447_09350 [Myxococcaceae bacterium]|nr:hypothetical protein [Myxococcaceae bacterium]
MRFPVCLRVTAAVVCLLSGLASADGAKATSPLFPLPSLDGKPLAAKADQKVFRVPLRMARVEQFYRDRFATEADVSLTLTQPRGKRILTLVSKRKGDAWKKAVAREGELETVIEITPVLRLAGEQVTGSGKPLVEFVLTRSEEVKKMVDGIDHLQRP